MASIIDIHTHVFAEQLAARAIPELAERSRLTPTYDGTIAGLLREMDRAGTPALSPSQSQQSLRKS